MIMDIMIHTICQSAPRQPPIKKPAMTGGVVQGIFNPLAGGIKPIAVTKYVNIVIAVGVNINGMIKMGFKTIGNPKVSGSLILKREGAKDSFPIDFNCSDFAKKQTTN